MAVFEAFFLEILVSLLTLAFAGWATVVWRMGNRLIERAAAVHDRVVELSVSQSALERDFREHERLKWHPEAGEALARINGLQRRD